VSVWESARTFRAPPLRKSAISDGAASPSKLVSGAQDGSYSEQDALRLGATERPRPDATHGLRPAGCLPGKGCSISEEAW
jgi:hypothetical protein